MAFGHVPGGFETAYNGFTFDPEYTYLTGLNIEPVKSRDGRTVLYNEFAFSFRTYVLGLPTDAIVMDALARLTKDGGEFRFQGRAIGSLLINTNGQKDVNFGPKVGTFGVVFIGPRSATQIDWKVVVSIPYCADAVYQFAPMDLSYTVEHKPRANGRVDRAVSGELRIANNRLAPGSRRIMDSPDNWRADVTPPVPEGFRREWSPWKVNDARTVLSFGWTDIEFDRNVYPPGIAWAEASHRLNSENVGLTTFSATIEGEYLVAAGYPLKVAEQAFGVLVRSRFASARAAMKADGQNGTILPTAFSSDESGIYSDSRQRFSLSYRLMNSTLRQCIAHSGQWTPTGSNWADWKNSMQASVLSPYGYSSMVFLPGDDLIVDLCGQQMESPGQTGSRKQQELRGFADEYPSAESSWLSYENHIRVEADSGLATFRDAGSESSGTGIAGGELVADLKAGPQPKAGVLTSTFSGTGGLSLNVASLLYGLSSPGAFLNPAMKQGNDFGAITGRLEENRIPSGQLEENRVQERAAPTCYVYMYGQALRAGFPIPCPELVDVEGVVPRKDNRLDRGEGFTCGVVGNAAVPVFGAKWNLRYFLDRIPAKPITPPANPLLGSR